MSSTSAHWPSNDTGARIKVVFKRMKKPRRTLRTRTTGKRSQRFHIYFRLFVHNDRSMAFPTPYNHLQNPQMVQMQTAYHLTPLDGCGGYTILAGWLFYTWGYGTGDSDVFFIGHFPFPFPPSLPYRYHSCSIVLGVTSVSSSKIDSTRWLRLRHR